MDPDTINTLEPRPMNLCVNSLNRIKALLQASELMTSQDHILLIQSDSITCHEMHFLKIALVCCI